MHPYSFHCNVCGKQSPHVRERHHSGETLWKCLHCGEFNLSVQTRKKKELARNPSVRSFKLDIARGRKLARDFSGHDVSKISLMKSPESSPVRVAVGTVTGIMYLARRDGETKEYLHRFAQGSRPSLAVTPDGKIVELRGGAFKFTERGIVDLKKRSRKT